MKAPLKRTYEWLRPEMVAQIEHEIGSSPAQQELLQTTDKVVGLVYKALVRSRRAKLPHVEAEFVKCCSNSLANVGYHIEERLADKYAFFTEAEFSLLTEHWQQLDAAESHTSNSRDL